MTDRIKFAYLTYDDMLSKLESGDLNEYDIIYSKDQYVTYLITEDLQPLQLRSRVYVFDSISEAEIKLNESTDTYVGQVVAILDDDTYRGYIVNQKSEKFTVTPLWEHSEPIDYDTLGNRPIVNLTGTVGKPIMVSELDDGIYRIKGQYKISINDITTYLNPNYCIFIINNSDEITYVKKISNEEIIDYHVTDTVIKTNLTITENYLSENGYATSSYIDKKIEALEIFIKDDIKSYIREEVTKLFNEQLDEKIDNRIDAKIISATEEEITSLFA